MANPTFDKIHDEIASVVGLTSIAFGVKYDWMSSNFANLVQGLGDLQPRPSDPLPVVATSIEKIHLALGGVPTDLTLGVDVSNKLMVLSGGVTLAFVTPDNTGLYRSRSFSLKNVPLKLGPDPSAKGEFRFEPQSFSGVTIDDPDPTNKPDPDFIKKFYNGDTAQYLEEEDAVMLAGGPMILQKFAHLVPFPRLQQVMRTFVLGENVEVSFTSEYLVVSAPPILQTGACPYEGSILRHMELRSSLAEAYTKRPRVEGVLEPKKSDSQDCQEGLPGLPNVLFYYPRDITLVSWSRSSIGPAIGAQDDGSWLLFEWHYAMATILNDIKITFDVAQATLTAISDWNLTGSAGAGVKIGCIVDDVVDAAVNGTIGPLSINLGPCIDPEGVVYLRATLSLPIKTDLGYSNDLLFPLNLVGDLILAMIGDRIFSPNVSAVVDLFKIKLIDMKGLPRVLKPANVGRSVRLDSLAVGLKLGA